MNFATTKNPQEGNVVHQNPHNNHQRPWWHGYLAFFLGTPRRFLGTLAGLFALFAAIRPDIAVKVINNILVVLFTGIANILGSFVAALEPSFPGLLGLAVVCFAFLCFWIAFKRSTRKPPPKKKGRH